MSTSTPGESPRKVRVDRDPLPRDVVHAIARPEFQQAVLGLLRQHGTLINSEGEYQGTLSIEPAASKEILKLENGGGRQLANLHRGFLIDFLRAHGQWVGNQEAIDNGRYNPELADAILDIVMQEEDIIRAEWKLPIISNALGEAKKLARNWMVVAGLALAAATGAAGALNNYAGKEVANDVAEWTDDAGDAIKDAQRDVKQWWKDLTDDKPKKSRRKK